MLLLPDEHREALQTFLSFLTDVAALSSINQMTPSNLAVCLAPSLFHLPATSSSSRTGNGGIIIPGNNNNTSIGSASGGGGSGTSPRRRKTVGVPDQRELSQNKAAHECLLQMINDYRNLFTVLRRRRKIFFCGFGSFFYPQNLILGTFVFDGLIICVSSFLCFRCRKTYSVSVAALTWTTVYPSRSRIFTRSSLVTGRRT